MRVAMVCMGNICRSPMAAAVAAALVAESGLGADIEIASFGTVGHHVGEAADVRARAALRRRGWPPLEHRARRLMPADVRDATLVLCADRSNLTAVRRLAPDEPASKMRLLRSFDPRSDPGAEVPDPWAGDDDAFDTALELIEAACRGLVEQLATTRR